MFEDNTRFISSDTLRHCVQLVNQHKQRAAPASTSMKTCPGPAELEGPVCQALDRVAMTSKSTVAGDLTDVFLYCPCFSYVQIVL